MLSSSRRALISQRLASVHGTRSDPTPSQPESCLTKFSITRILISIPQAISNRSPDHLPLSSRVPVEKPPLTLPVVDSQVSSDLSGEEFPQ
ncbi:hypothetical protein AVEN_217918-1 [Araneus ventricosus]|uniref:Uncharacterized protein n=1 Tax=Araneus ventricosus TaxID=182803 RepID=A0A4Y2U1Z0_ARAVE|nr:hypothetical protein AVEN_217918-1 [Araneus ventricosus]